jgi:hypothetical protein
MEKSAFERAIDRVKRAGKTGFGAPSMGAVSEVRVLP